LRHPAGRATVEACLSRRDPGHRGVMGFAARLFRKHSECGETLEDRGRRRGGRAGPADDPPVRACTGLSA
jgi:hypothetical protein